MRWAEVWSPLAVAPSPRGIDHDPVLTAPNAITVLRTVGSLVLAMAGLAATKAHWIRIVINWEQTQPSPTTINDSDPNPGASSGLTWGVADTIIRAARNNGLRVLGVILLTPPWAGSSACSSSYQQTNYVPFWLCAPDPTLYTNFARAAA